MSGILWRAEFPRANAYHPDWLAAGVSGGANPLWLAEWLSGALDLEPGMRVLDLGCGRGMSSVFLAREFGVTVFAVDLWFDPAETLRRAQDAGVGGAVVPLRGDLRALPFAPGFFDAAVCIDSYPYFGTDDHTPNLIARLVRPGGQVGVAGAGLAAEIAGEPPEHLRAWYAAEPGLWSLHSAAWVARQWTRSGLLDVAVADDMPDGWRRWLDWHRVVAPGNHGEIGCVEADAGRTLAYVRLAGRRRDGALVEEPVTRVPTEYAPAPLLRGPA